MSRILDTAVLAAEMAGQFLSEKFGRVTSIERKADTSLVTEVDKRAEQIVVDVIRENFPRHSICAEERGLDSKDGDWLWIIDPLDGTHNFIRSIPLYGVSIGVAHNNEFVAGVIYLPSEEEFFVAEKGSGAFKNDRKIKVSSVNGLQDASMGFDSTLKVNSSAKSQVMSGFAREVFNVRMFGSSARNLTFIAEGKLDLVIEFDDHLWDFGGAACIISEAGGSITDFSGKPALPVDGQRYIASNGLIHAQAINLMQKLV
jgi:myo-inositol-1(or 4)-monophosphatase